MPIPSPLYSRTAALCTTQEWRDWSGYFSAITYGPSHEVEYYAVRNAAGLMDASPLYKYEIRGADAERLLDRMVTRNVAKSRVGQVLYTPWCDEDGKVIDDGTLARLGKNHFRLTAADPSLRWLQDVGYGLDVELRDVSTELAALALQGPNSYPILKSLVSNLKLKTLRYYNLLQTEFNNSALTITRTGYTGDLGYELWIAAEHAATLWDGVMQAGAGYGIMPLGLAALDILRVEAGLLLIEVDYSSTLHARIPEQQSSPYEIGLGWAVDLDKGDFIGKQALQAEHAAGTPRSLVGLEVDWHDLERLFGEANLPPQVAGRASRTAVPVYANGQHVGQATSMVFSPILKKYIALATVRSEYAARGTPLEFEITVEYERKRAGATVSKMPFYNPAQKRALPNG
ncbi:MAG TPA: aminomethyltransferase family protein [Anaerolineales bacterium]|nr:aminomethyltransferase family protein [Anaerolineales bacterium]HRQ93049.1 aminomethyltransferase family protein [Anaerolineales bacterium]